ncbi:hypothetical protein FB45DRAFT_938925 [Roridomyces roridus]|uniref:Uncharacterized protein n=1 Tax=Roridomyces roridus TaxID=1738132 RepID=A0AAD7FDY9_9AGAR|nr:hypothetical protein FB45DRAFT_938925 [Roridomyces roridus]
MSFSLVSVSLAGLALSTLFYGMYCVLFLISTYLLIRKFDAEAQTGFKQTNSSGRNSVYRTTVFNFSILLFVLVTSHWMTVLTRVFLAFRDPRGAETFFGDLRGSTAVAENIILSFCITLGDSLIIHRRKSVLIVPVLSLLALMVMITWRIWTVSRPTTTYLLSHSADINVSSVWAVLFFVAYHIQSNVQLTIIEAAPAIVGFVNALIQTRVGLGWTSEQMGVSTESTLNIRFAASGHA